MKFMVIGNGGREHTIAWALAKSGIVSQVICTPGNAGTACEAKCVNIPPKGSANSDYVQIAKENAVDIVVVGPEVPLAQGVADDLRAASIPCVGPQKSQAILESSKDFAKQFMQKYAIPCAKSKTFTDSETARHYLASCTVPIVIKADGLAAGKGVVVAASKDEAVAAIHDIMENDSLHGAGKKVVIEEYLDGTEVSCLCAVCVKDGKATIKPFLPARDHKRACDGNKGLNTGGMGAICPAVDLHSDQWKRIVGECIQPTLRAIKKEFGEYQGFIFLGLMLTSDGPKVLEYNIRLGDPETQAVLPLLKSDFAILCQKIAMGTLCDSDTLEWEDCHCVAPVVVSKGYPVKYEKSKPITIDAQAIQQSGAKIFMAGVATENGNLVTSGGRVLCCSSCAPTFDAAFQKAYQAVQAVHFDGATFRHDIGKS